MKYDLIVIGAGPAGVSAALYAKSRGVNVLIIEKKNVGGIIGNVSTVTHYSGIIGNETGASFAKRLKEQALRAGIQIEYEDVNYVSLDRKVKKVMTDKNIYEADTVVIANGSTPRKLGIPGEEEFAGKGIGLNAACDAVKYEGKNVYVVGGADGAVKEAIYLAQFAKKVTIIYFEDKLGCIDEFSEKIKLLDNIELKLLTRLTGVYGKEKVESLELLNEVTGKKEIVEDKGCGIFVYAGLIPNTQMYKCLQLENGFIPVNDKMETEVPGVYAVGDIRVKQVRQVATAVSDGAVAAVNAFAYIQNIKKEKELSA